MVVHVFGKALKDTALVRSKIFGLGFQAAERICAKVGVYPQMTAQELTEPQIMAINKELSTMQVEEVLKQSILENIATKRRIGSYVGFRHSQGLPVRGQNTRNNAHTAKKLNRVERKINLQ